MKMKCLKFIKVFQYQRSLSYNKYEKFSRNFSIIKHTDTNNLELKYLIKCLDLLTGDKTWTLTYLSIRVEQRKLDKLPAKCIEAVAVAAGTFDIVAVLSSLGQAGTDWDRPRTATEQSISIRKSD